jgi:trans-2,3-dihydro-3-hydroxyanthranilate isomerase
MTNDKSYDYIHLDVFTTTRMEGNALAVFPRAEGITDEQMQRIARELNFSETVFLLNADTKLGCIARTRIFTPFRELDFAGHPTIGSAYVIGQQHPGIQSFSIQENVGGVPISVETTQDGGTLFWLTSPAITFFETVDRVFCAELIGLTEGDLALTPPQFVSAGNTLLFIQVARPEMVDRAELRLDLVSRALGSANSVGTFVFAQKEPSLAAPFDVYSRMFAPQIGIPEDAATGGATGPLAAYMVGHGLIPGGNGETQFVSEQGAKIGRRSLLHVRITRGGEVIQVGGSAVLLAKGELIIDG